MTGVLLVLPLILTVAYPAFLVPFEQILLLRVSSRRALLWLLRTCSRNLMEGPDRRGHFLLLALFVTR
jgi:hypothetical protein